MIHEFPSETLHVRQGFFKKAIIQRVCVFVLIISAFAVRLYHIDRPPFDFAALRQYQSAHIARGNYFESLRSLPEWRRNVAELNMKRMGLLLEPRILENLTVSGYRILGGEHLWIPRVLSSLFWLIGGIFLYVTAQKIASSEAALFSTAFYLFLPFSILASRSFQPDPLMIMFLLFSIFMIINFFKRPSSLKLISAAIVSALAMLVKPYSLFFIFGTFVSLGIYKHGVRKALFSIQMLIYFMVSIIPTCTYYVYGILTNVGYLNELAQGSFLPHLILKSYFWKEWFVRIGNVIGYIPFAGALIGLFTIKQGFSKALLSGLWIGYIIFGLFFTMHIHTHNYYHLPFIPVIALSLGPVGVWIVNFLYRHWKIAILSVLALAGVAGVMVTQVDLEKFVSKNKNNLKTVANFIGINRDFKKFITDDFEREVQMAKEIGEIVGHSTNTVLLTPYFGRTIAYNGELSGLPWPKQSSLRERRERGLRPLGKDELFNPGYLTIRTHGNYIKYTPDFFIVTDFNEFEAQKDLKDFLNTNFPVIAQSKDYLIYDLRMMSETNR